MPVLLSTVDGISILCVYPPKDLRLLEARETVWRSILEVPKRFPDGIPLLDPIANMNITDEKFKVLVEMRTTQLFILFYCLIDKRFEQKIQIIENKLYGSPMHRNPRLPELYSQYLRKVDIQTRIRGLRKKIQATKDILQLEELTKCRKRVLRRLAFISSNDDIVEMKGRVACEISSGDELLLTELIFNGGFNSLTPEQCAGLLSCFVFTEKVSSK